MINLIRLDIISGKIIACFMIKYSKLPDQRLTIYWNGDITTDNNGKATLSFFTADAPATYIATVTGITVNGNKIYKTIMISRK